MEINQVAPSAPPGLYRLAAAAAVVGISVDLLEASIKRGDIPVNLVKLGERGLAFVRATELHAWLTGPVASVSPADGTGAGGGS
ncbi:helix-turn-helix transcriptional regulator [Cupriavidus necator]|uniref:helix-turn-helix transcriptional regulator n=1 Tax=Cupriavidus necator TaxID=106590 RepID=UPI0005B51682|nr:hypothetical protein [Cupriavidus necator]